MDGSNVQVFKKILPRSEKLPILISVPHVGTYIPHHIKSTMDEEIVSTLDDTDFFVDKIYEFATELGISLIISNYSRYVIDLNRSPDAELLYSDGRNATLLVPLLDFSGKDIYKNEKLKPDAFDIQNRIKNYYFPYHHEVEAMLKQFKSDFGHALLFDAHSIRRNIPAICPEPISDMILGDNNGQSADQEIIITSLGILEKSGYTINHNTPFKGGYITRNYGKPEHNIHALQLEMSKDIYMDTDTSRIDNKKIENLKTVLTQLLNALIINLTR